MVDKTAVSSVAALASPRFIRVRPPGPCPLITAGSAISARWRCRYLSWIQDHTAIRTRPHPSPTHQSPHAPGSPAMISRRCNALNACSKLIRWARYVWGIWQDAGMRSSRALLT
eukprot:3558941-Prymnesium_polylepis.2